MKTKGTIFTWEPWGTEIIVSIGESVDQVKARISKTGYKLDAEEEEKLAFSGRRGRTVMLRGGQTVLWLRRFNGDPDSTGTLAHEAFHAVCFVLDHAGIRFGDDSDEAFAYSLDWLMRKILTWARGA